MREGKHRKTFMTESDQSVHVKNEEVQQGFLFPPRDHFRNKLQFTCWMCLCFHAHRTPLGRGPSATRLLVAQPGDGGSPARAQAVLAAHLSPSAVGSLCAADAPRLRPSPTAGRAGSPCFHTPPGGDTKEAQRSDVVPDYVGESKRRRLDVFAGTYLRGQPCPRHDSADWLLLLLFSAQTAPPLPWAQLLPLPPVH